MPSLNSGSSVYHTIQAFYWRHQDGTLLSAEGRSSATIKKTWPSIQHHVVDAAQQDNQVELPSGKIVSSKRVVEKSLDDLDIGDGESLWSLEMRYPESDMILGLFTIRSDFDSTSKDLLTWAEFFVLSETRLLPPPETMVSRSAIRTTRLVTDIFNRKLRNIAPNDQWYNAGRNYFEERILDFVARGLPIDLCLPAFPCKSPNPEKTSGMYPDRAEYLALSTLRDFTRAVADVYHPGATLLIVSDGHVFSDLLGVRDENVDIYGEALKQMHRRASAAGEDFSSIQFTSLTEIFFGNKDVTASFKPEWTESMQLEHPIASTISEEAELCRKLMMAVGQIDETALLEMVAAQDVPTLKLYRGLMKFMSDDLAHNKSFASKGSNQRKRIISRVAKVMIIRNYAYSNLVELLFPSHIRLSIHAHDNSGPKFGIRLFPKQSVRVVEDLASCGAQVSLDEYHTPTAWHNCLVYIDGEAAPYLVKARAAHKAIDDGLFEGQWVETETGGHFALTQKRVLVTIDASALLPAVNDEKTGSALVQVNEIAMGGRSPPMFPHNSRAVQPV
ncbi:Pyoverdine/dityrosine biosynthesis protein-domain-containing protein [Phyllosticta citribraziliensis]|uniref:Pyoverdine/dityrosine biosynthesis protein-domain-containing protein n=1 Tax=Phyllosticta citribraziliensis TaxID=989973 RepID=A0ABR1LTH4_9PEZI